MSLRVYTVHTLPDRDPRHAAARTLPELVKEGFSWPAFFLGFVWALYHRLWLAAVLLIVVSAGLSTLYDVLRLDDVTMALVSLAFAVIVGMFANDWRRAGLRRRGWREQGVVTAPNMDTALRRYLDLSAIGASSGAFAPRGADAGWRAPDAGPWGPARP